MKRISSLVCLTTLSTFFIPEHQATAQSTLSYTDASIHFRNGREYFESRNYEAAKTEFAQYLQTEKSILEKNDGNQIWAEYYLVMCSLYLNNTETEVLASRFIRNNSEHPMATSLYKEIGNYFFANGDYTRATDYLSKSSKSDYAAQYKLAVAYFSLQNYTQALTIFDELKQNATDAYAVPSSYYAGVINFRAAHYGEAIPDFQRAEVSPEYRSEIPSWLAHSFYRQGKFSEMLAYTEPILRDKNSGRKLDEVALLTAEVYFQKGNYDKAAQYYTIYNNYKSQAILPMVSYRFGYSLFKSNQFALAAEQLKNVASSKDTLGQDAAFTLGICYLKADNGPYALGAFDQARKLNFNLGIQEEAFFNYAKVLYELGRSAESIREFEAFFRAYPNSRFEDEANELVSEAYLSSNNFQAALLYIEGLKKRSRRINTAYQRIAFNQGVKKYNEDNYVDAIPFFDKSLSTPENAELKYAASFWKAEALSGQKKYAEAIPFYQGIINSVDNTTPSLAQYQNKSRYGIGYAYFNTKAYDKANSYFRDYADRMKASDPQSYQDASLRLADTYFVQKNYDQALKKYDEVIANGKSDKDYALLQKGEIYFIKQEYQAARAAFDKVQSTYPNSVYADNAMFRMGESDLKARQYTIAITDLTRLINEKPRSPFIPQALLYRAGAFANNGNRESAVTDYKTIIKNYPTDSIAKSALEGAQEQLNELGRPEEFTALLDGFQRNNPNDGSLDELEYESAKNLFYKESYDKAVAGLSDYIRKHPTSKYSYEAKYLLAEAYNSLGNKQQALNYYYQVIADNKYKSVNKVTAKVADIEFKAGNYKKSATAYRVLQSIAPDKKDQQTALIGLMESYYQLKSDSTLYFAKEVSSNGDIVAGAKSKASLYTGKILLAKNNYIGATEAFNQTILIDKGDSGAEAMYLNAQILYTQKKYRESSELIIDRFVTEYANCSDLQMGKAYLLLADDFVGMNNNLQAKVTLNSLITGSPEKDIVAEAKAKLKVIERK